jgi:hypothetical protein
MKRNFAKITYTNCDSVEYGHTICELQDVQDNLFPIDQDFKDFDKEKEYKENDYALPSIKIELVKISDRQFSKWFKSIEKNA